jgi:hypothetical protein
LQHSILQQHVIGQDCGLLAMHTLVTGARHQLLIQLTPAAGKSLLLEQQRTSGSSCVVGYN